MYSEWKGPWESMKEALNEYIELITLTALSGQTMKVSYESADNSHGFEV